MRPSSHARAQAAALRGKAAALCLALACLGAGCAQDLSLHAHIGPSAPIPDLPDGEPWAGGVNVAGVGVERVEVVLREIRLESRATVGDEASAGRKPVVRGPQRLELSGDQLQPDVLTPIVIGVHSGVKSFYELDADLRPVTPDEAALDPALAPLTGESLAISGTYRGRPFTFASSVEAVLKGEAVFRMGTNHNNIDLNFSPSGWFRGEAGEELDPSDPANQAAIEQNIVRSFSAFEDDNLDGQPDPLG